MGQTAQHDRGLDHRPAGLHVLDLAPLPVEEPYREETTEWADRVNWAAVNAEAIVVVRASDGHSAPDYEAPRFNEVDREALWSLFAWPIDANEQQITNGIHRITAMRRQGETQTVGLLIE